MTRTRFAPSTSGFMHVGNLRSALFAYLLARHEQGEFILRIEDTEQKHKKLGAEEFVYQMLENFRLYYDEGPKKEGEFGPYIQSERLDIYKTYAEKLVKKGYAYYCFCEEATLQKKRIEDLENHRAFMYDGTCRNFPKDEALRRIAAGEKYVIRQKVPKEGQTSYHDVVYGDVTVENNAIEDQILMKSDGMPTYNFANVVDDALMGITHVTRGCEYLTSTPKYLLLYDALHLPQPIFVHLPLVLKKDKKKISKRNKDEDLSDLLKQGFLPEAIINYLAFLGWSPKSNQEFFTLDELIQEFSIERIHKRPACFSIEKLKWYNRHYIKKMNKTEYLNYARPFLETMYNVEGLTDDWINILLLAFQKRISFGAEIPLFANLFFKEDIEYDENLKNISNEEFKSFLSIFIQKIETMDNWSVDGVQEVVNSLNDKKNQLMSLRITLTGCNYGIDLCTTIYLLGKEKVLARVGVL